MNIPDGFTEWVWTEDKPYPETLDTKVFVIFRDGTFSNMMYPEYVYYWHDHSNTSSNWFPAGEGFDIIAYKVAES